MNFGQLINDSVGYTRETFAGHWVRWLIFILLSLPLVVTRFVFDPQKIFDGTTIHWEQIPWVPLAGLVILGILLSFFITGYTVRIYRGVKPADFTGWASLFIDGIKLEIVAFVWFLPAIVVFLAWVALILGAVLFGLPPNPGAFVLLILLILVELILFIIGLLFMILGGIRFARTGSMTEGWRFSAILQTVRRIGWVKYIIALILLLVIWVVFYIVVAVPALIPYIGWIIPVILSPLMTVFTARYFTLVYEAGEEPPVVVPPPAVPAP